MEPSNALPIVWKNVMQLENNWLYDPQAFTLDSVPPAEDEIVAGGIGRNFISRDLLEATSMDDAMNVRFCLLLLPILMNSFITLVFSLSVLISSEDQIVRNFCGAFL